MNAPALSSPWADSTPGTSQPAARQLALPSAADRWAYGCRWWAQVLPDWLQRHRLQPSRAGRYQADFTVSPALHGAFGELFDLRRSAQEVAYPFLHAQGTITLLQARVLADLGVNRRHVRQLRHHTRFPAGSAAYLAATEQRVECSLQRTVRVSPTDVLLLMNTRISNRDGLTVAQVEDGLVVQGLQVAYAVQAEEDDLLRRAVGRMRRRTPELDDGSPNLRMRQLYIGSDAGRRFGRLSGERSPVHHGQLGARLMGRQRPFVQGMYLRNLVCRELAEWGVDQHALQITFTGQAGLGQTLCLLLQGQVFELVDLRGRLIAFGKAS